MRKIAAVASGEIPTAEELEDGLSALQVMLRMWAGEKIAVFASSKDDKTLTVGTYVYTWGSGGDIATARPNQINGAYILDSGGNSHPVGIISEGTYRNISVKGTVGRPYLLFYHPQYPLASLYLYYVPNAAETLHIDSFKPFTETSSFSALADELDFPSNYEEAVIYNLAIRLAPEFGKTIPAEVANIAVVTYEKICNRNIAEQMEPISIDVPAGRQNRAYYNINSDGYN
jgi:hypothetical protein